MQGARFLKPRRLLGGSDGSEKEQANSHRPYREGLGAVSSPGRRIAGTKSELPQRACFGEDGEESLPGPTIGCWQGRLSTSLRGLPRSQWRRLGKHSVVSR